MLALKLIVACVLLALVAAGASALAAAGGTAEPSVAPPIPSPTTLRKIDEYGDISFADEKARLDNLAIEVEKDPEARAVLVAYAGRRARVGEARRRLERARRHLVFTRGLKPGRVLLIDGGYREELTVELWALPPGVEPEPSPLVDPSEVRIITEASPPKRAARKPRRRN